MLRRWIRIEIDGMPFVAVFFAMIQMGDDGITLIVGDSVGNSVDSRFGRRRFGICVAGY